LSCERHPKRKGDVISSRRRFTPLLFVLSLFAAGCASTEAGSGSPAVKTSASATADESAPPASPDATDSATSESEPASDASSETPGSAEVPSEDNPDPSASIPGIYIGDPSLYEARYHFEYPDRVAYDRYPPVGGPHDPVWAACDGAVYDVPIRNEMMVHSLEHGAVWIAYNPDSIDPAELEHLQQTVPTMPYVMLSPYPDLTTPLSLQFWGHQLPLDSAADQRFDQFVEALRRNSTLTPEPSATCSNPEFIAGDHPFDGTGPGPDAIPLDFTPPTAESTGSTSSESPSTRSPSAEATSSEPTSAESTPTS
jgi:hypothetical protein